MSDPALTSGVPSLLAPLRRHAKLVALLTLLGVGIGLLVALVQPKSYTAESRVFLSAQVSFDALGPTTYSSDPSRYLDQQAGVLTSTPLLSRAIELGASGSVDELRESIDVVSSAESDVLTVRASASEPDEAAKRADTVIEAYRDYQRNLVESQLKALEGVSNATERRVAQQRAAIFGDGVQLVDEASVNSTSSAIRNATVLGLVGLLLGSGIAFFNDAHGTTAQWLSRRRSSATTGNHVLARHAADDSTRAGGAGAAPASGGLDYAAAPGWDLPDGDLGWSGSDAAATGKSFRRQKATRRR